MRFGVREIIFLVLLGAIPLSAWWFAFRPAMSRDAEMMAQIEAQQERLRELNRATATIGDMEQEIESLNEAIGYFRAKLPTEKEMDQVIRELWRLAEGNDLTTKSIRPIRGSGAARLTDPSGPYAEQPISMTLEGPFKGLYGFLIALERQPRIMRVLDVTIQKGQRCPEGVVRTKCLMSVFFERSSEG